MNDAEDPRLEALRTELRQRVAAEARAQGELADLRSQLSAREAAHRQFTAVREELRGELNRLIGLVAEQDDRRSEVESRAMVMAADLDSARQEVTDLRAERDRLSQELSESRSALASARASRDTAMAEAEALRSEIERLGQELAAARQQGGEDDAGVQEAEALLAQARELTATLRQE